MTAKILLIEDDAAIHDLIRVNVEGAGYSFDHAGDGESGLSKALCGECNLVILDLNIPKLSGLDVCRRIRATKPNLPIIMLTAQSSEVDKVVGLELGADDYVTKPFSVRELMARVRARLRSQSSDGGSASDGEASELVVGELTIDLERRRVLKRGVKVDLTQKEFELVLLLASNAGRPFTREQLLETIWGLSASSYESNVNTLITRLRKKIEDDQANPRYLLTVYGYGYRFVDREELEGS